MLCPFGAITTNDGRKSAVKCDHCTMLEKLGKEPACVTACPTSALAFVEPERFVKDRRAKAAEAAARTEG
jgi:carbon-monoxide dehydrogenase iron sulfur subunit